MSMKNTSVAASKMEPGEQLNALRSIVREGR